MELPIITLPKIDLPFDIPVLLHPAVDHFAIALPVVILLLEFYNLFAKRKSIGGFSFILLVITVVIFALAYLTGSVDGKEAYDLLSPEGQAELKEHKLLGTYLLIGTVVVLFFKLLAMTGKGFFKFLLFLSLLGLIVVTFKQGKDGGELVYEYGANVEKVKTLDDELFDVKEALEEANEVKVPASGSTENIKKEVPSSVQDENTSKKTEGTVETLLESAKKEMHETSQKVLDTLKEASEDVAQKAAAELTETPSQVEN